MEPHNERYILIATALWKRTIWTLRISGTMTEPVEYNAKWLKGPFTDDLHHIAGTGLFEVSSKKVKEKQVYYLMRFRQHVEDSVTFEAMNSARPMRAYRDFFEEAKQNANALFTVPIDRRDWYTPEQWAQTLKDDAKLRSMRSESLLKYEADLSSLRGKRVDLEKALPQGEADLQYSQRLRDIREQHAQRQLDIEREFQDNTWWITRIRRLNRQDLSTFDKSTLVGLDEAQQKAKTKELILALQKELMDFYNKEDYESIGTRVSRFPLPLE